MRPAAKQQAISPSPLVSVMVCTRNRAHNPLFTVNSILASDYSHFELIVIDQSDDNATEEALKPIVEAESRLYYFHLGVPGKPLALNRARQQIRGELIALTDDDCEVDPHWIQALVDAFHTSSEIGCVFGEVLPAPHDTQQGYIEGCHLDGDDTIQSLRDFFDVRRLARYGIGANQAVRADVLEAIGGWDPCIGPGARFGSGDDHDLATRVLLAGSAIRFCTEARVVHFGFRSYEHETYDIRRCWYGSGATFAKYMRCGVFYHAGARRLVHGLQSSLTRAAHRQRPLHLAYPRAWLSGFSAGCRHAVDRRQKCFVGLDDTQSRQYGDFHADVKVRIRASEGEEPGVGRQGAAVKVSIVIPAYNAIYLRKTLESVLQQTFTDWELIVVDDGSSDETPQTAAEFASRDARIRLLRQENAGASTARNRGYAASHPDTEFIVFLDSDDVWEPDALEVLTSALEAHPKALASYGIARYIDSDGQFIRVGELEGYQRNRYAVQGDRLIPWPLDRPTIFAVEVVMDYIATPGVALIRRSALEQSGLFDTQIKFFEDWDLWLNISRLGEIVFVDHLVLRYRRHDQNLSNDMQALIEGGERVRRKLLKSLENDPEKRHIALKGHYHQLRVYPQLRMQWAVGSLRKGKLMQAAKHLRHAGKSYTLYLKQRPQLRELMKQNA